MDGERGARHGGICFDGDSGFDLGFPGEISQTQFAVEASCAEMDRIARAARSASDRQLCFSSDSKVFIFQVICLTWQANALESSPDIVRVRVDRG